ncbi:TIGR03915 family putative DNA repair protein [Paenimyroides aestuarii]|uniref:TIGR03915 family putative DNA repair protein n=1 Tax=Paenimyroides aestuarii TaxID=2968490 RepID=A0ABY5NUM4_9FLAO|nr:TIGR03915 family putative DNA repair protein [Paenimyroides aestuarii]UUV22295.1 TIGR03915 family putative DNA repair protein [Paenimyroides aestuarii]
MNYVFDGSYLGFLCCVFECFEMKEWKAVPVAEGFFQPDIFMPERTIFTDVDKAKRIQNALINQFGKATADDFYKAFLSEDTEAWNAAFYIMVSLFKGNHSILEHFGDLKVLYFHQTLKKVSRERHRMKAFIRFSKSSDGLYFAVIEPDFNVLPLILSFFRNRYTDMPWVIYDVKRKYGFHYNLKGLYEIVIDKQEQTAFQNTNLTIALDERDELFKRLWKQYFKSTNIEARKNMKLHVQHVPKRYWKYLVEKQ